MNKALWLFGGELTILADAATTDGQYDLVVCAWLPGLAIPLHMHTRYAEAVYLEEGELTIYTPGSTRVLRAGEHARIPPATPHAIVITSKTVSRGLTITSPSGFA